MFIQRLLNTQQKITFRTDVKVNLPFATVGKIVYLNYTNQRSVLIFSVSGHILTEANNHNLYSDTYKAFFGEKKIIGVLA